MFTLTNLHCFPQKKKLHRNPKVCSDFSWKIRWDCSLKTDLKKYAVSNAIQCYKFRVWQIDAHFSTIGFYLAGKPDDGINLAIYSLPSTGSG